MTYSVCNRIYIVGPADDLHAIAEELADRFPFYVYCDGRYVHCDLRTNGLHATVLIQFRLARPRLTVGHLWWTEDGERHGCGIYVLGTTEYECWDEGLYGIERRDYDEVEHAVEAAAAKKHMPMIMSCLGLPRTRPAPGVSSGSMMPRPPDGIC